MKLPGPGNPPNSNSPITIREVAAEAGVSTATVSRALAGLDGVAKEARDRVTRAVAKLNYRPNRLARGLRLGHRKVIGVIIPDLQNPFFTGVVHGVEAELSSAGYTLLLGNSDGLAEREKEQLEILRGEGAAGLVFIPGNQPETNYEAIRTWGIPLVAVDRSPGELHVDLVCSSNREGMRQAVSHLLSLGYKDVALLNGPKGISVTQERLGGYQDALRSAGIAVRESLIIHSDFRQSGGYAAMARILDMSKRPRAIAVANNLMTLGALQAIHERGVRIPEELAVVCFDDMPWAISLRPPLTAVSQPAEELGRTAAQLLLERLKDPNRLVRQVVLPTRLIVRASCGALTPVQAERPAEPHPRKTGAATARTISRLKVQIAPSCVAAALRSFNAG
jgi:DNA-binding LacI/PurR family transcriptional regulator